MIFLGLHRRDMQRDRISRELLDRIHLPSLQTQKQTTLQSGRSNQNQYSIGSFCNGRESEAEECEYLKSRFLYVRQRKTPRNVIVACVYFIVCCWRYERWKEEKEKVGVPLVLYYRWVDCSVDLCASLRCFCHVLWGDVPRLEVQTMDYVYVDILLRVCVHHTTCKGRWSLSRLSFQITCLCSYP